MASKTTAILDLETLKQRRVINIDKKPYELREPGELFALEYERYAAKFTRLGLLFSRGGRATVKEKAERVRLLDELTRVVLQAPEAVHDRLQIPQRFQIVSVFLQALPATMKGIGMAAAAQGRASRNRSARSRRGFHGSTAARHGNG